MNGAADTGQAVAPPPPAQARWLRGLLVAATVLFVAGICTPMLTISKFIVVANTFSVLSGVAELLRNGNYLLFVLVAGFSIVLPLLKIGVLYRIVARQPHDRGRLARLLRLMHDYGRWAMLDVMVVAVLIMTVKLGAIASIEVHYGLYLFGGAVLLIMLLTEAVVRLAERAGQDPGKG